MKDSHYDVVIIGGGASGTALVYTLAQYTNITNIALFEKYSKPAQVNSMARNNSQTLHEGDIETNYSIQKALQVRPAARMVVEYVKTLPQEVQKTILFQTPKMVLAVGKDECDTLQKRYQELSVHFTDLQFLTRDELAVIEPALVNGRSVNVPLCAIYTTSGYAVNFETLAQSFVNEAQKQSDRVSVFFSTEIVTMKKSEDGYELVDTMGNVRTAKSVVVDADSYSLLFAKQLGYGKEFSLIPIAGSFYFSKELLKGKVYTVQHPELPFAAVHGDPDVEVPGKTRWGPTARFFPVLEARNFATMKDYFTSSGLNKFATWISFLKILLNPVRFYYLLSNMLYELPVIGTLMFLKNVRKIVPSIKLRDVTKAKGYGGMRLQRVDTKTQALQLGEGKIIGDNIVFNMTPSPGASVCLYNAMRDAELVVGFLGDSYVFEKERMQQELVCSQNSGDDVSQNATYPA